MRTGSRRVVAPDAGLGQGWAGNKKRKDKQWQDGSHVYLTFVIGGGWNPLVRETIVKQVEIVTYGEGVPEIVMLKRLEPRPCDRGSSGWGGTNEEGNPFIFLNPYIVKPFPNK